MVARSAAEANNGGEATKIDRTTKNKSGSTKPNEGGEDTAIVNMLVYSFCFKISGAMIKY